MIYDIRVNDKTIYNESKNMILVDPSMSTSLNSAGSCEFTMPPNHTFYNNIKFMTDTVDVYEDGNLIFTGRPSEISTDYWKQKKVYCEGALAYFNDTIQRPKEYETVSIKQFFKDLIANHNSQVAANRQFTVGDITIYDKQVYRKLDYNTTWDAINKMCLNAEGGYLFVRKENGVLYIDWLEDMPYITNQPITFGINLTDISQDLKASEICTSVIPLGKETDSARLTVTSVNGGKDCIDSEAIDTFGRITKVQEFNDDEDAATLLKDGKEWLTKKQFDHLTIKVKAAELHYLGKYKERFAAFKVGQKIHVASTPHLIDTTLPLLSLDIDLDSAVKTVTLGTVEQKDLTEITANKTK